MSSLMSSFDTLALAELNFISGVLTFEFEESPIFEMSRAFSFSAFVS
jgi:hypothetical protein